MGETNHRVDVRVIADRAEVFDAVDAVATVDWVEASLHDVPVTEARTRFAAEGRHELAILDHLAKEASLLRLARDGVDDRHDSRVHVERQRCGRAAFRELDHALRVRECISADTADSSRHRLPY